MLTAYVKGEGKSMRPYVVGRVVRIADVRNVSRKNETDFVYEFDRRNDGLSLA